MFHNSSSHLMVPRRLTPQFTWLLTSLRTLLLILLRSTNLMHSEASLIGFIFRINVYFPSSFNPVPLQLIEKDSLF